MLYNSTIKSLALTIFSVILLSPVSVFADSTSHQLQVAATILDRGHCSFETPGPYLINFDPALDPLAAVERAASVTFQVRCKGVGHHGSTVVVDRTGSEQLYLTKDSDSIPYSLNLPTSRPIQHNQPADITVTATIAENTYRNASPGLYSDTLTITVEP